jgi:ferric-dicitrate binding protein FerR (iron transport regulator)
MNSSSYSSDRGHRNHALVLAVALHLSLGLLLYMHAGESKSASKQTTTGQTAQSAVKTGEKTLLMP